MIFFSISGCVGDAESFPGILSFVPTQGLLLVFVLHFPVHVFVIVPDLPEGGVGGFHVQAWCLIQLVFS